MAYSIFRKLVNLKLADETHIKPIFVPRPVRVAEAGYI